MAQAEPRDGVNRRATVFAAVAWLYLGGIVVQVVVAGASLFGDLDWTYHEEIGWGLGTGVLLILVAGLAARPDRTTVALLVALAVSGILQPELAEARSVAPFVAALHPVNAMVLAWLAWRVARRATELSRGRSSDLRAAVTDDAGQTAEGPGLRVSPSDRATRTHETSSPPTP